MRFLILVVFLLTACGTELERPLSFTAINPDKVDKTFYGSWTGNVMLESDATKKRGFDIGALARNRSEWLTTIHVNSGSGHMCFSSNTENGILKVKYLKGILYVQDGSSFIIKKTQNKGILHAVQNTLLGAYYYLHADKLLKEASVYCQNNFPG